MSNYISPYVSAYRKGYNSQHVLIRLLEEWRQHLDNNKVVGGVFMDLSKAFDCVPHDLLLAKLAAYSVVENLLISSIKLVCIILLMIILSARLNQILKIWKQLLNLKGRKLFHNFSLTKWFLIRRNFKALSSTKRNKIILQNTSVLIRKI